MTNALAANSFVLGSPGTHAWTAIPTLAIRMVTKQAGMAGSRAHSDIPPPSEPIVRNAKAISPNAAQSGDKPKQKRKNVRINNSVGASHYWRLKLKRSMPSQYS